MLTTAGIAFLAASAKLATRGVLTGVDVSCSRTTVPALVRESGEQIRAQRRDDEQCREAQRAGLSEEEPEPAEQGGLGNRKRRL